MFAYIFSLSLSGHGVHKYNWLSMATFLRVIIYGVKIVSVCTLPSSSSSLSKQEGKILYFEVHEVFSSFNFVSKSCYVLNQEYNSRRKLFVISSDTHACSSKGCFHYHWSWQVVNIKEEHSPVEAHHLNCISFRHRYKTINPEVTLEKGFNA